MSAEYLSVSPIASHPVAYSVRSFSPATDIAGLTELWQESFVETEIEAYIHERFAWLYADTPDNRAQTWVVTHDATQRIVGCGSAYRADRYIRGRAVGGAVTVIFAVTKAHRFGGAALAIQRAILASTAAAGVHALVGRPNQASAAIIGRIGYKPLGTLVNWVCDIEPEKTDDISVKTDGYLEEVCAHADERFDDLWRRGRERHESILVERTAAFLNWRYSGFREMPCRIYCLVRPDDESLAGYVVYRPWEQGFLIPDVFCADPGPGTYDALLAGFIARMRAEGAHWLAVSFLGASWFAECLARHGFSPANQHHESVMTYLHPAVDADLRLDMSNPDRWSLFGGDSHIFV